MADKKVIGGAEVARRLKALRTGIRATLQDSQVADLLEKRVRGRFAEGVDPNNNPWPGLMESTVERKYREGVKEPKALLRATDRLYNSIKIIQGGVAGLLAGNTGLGFRIGVSDPYAASYGRLHNFGIGQEKRQFIGLSRLDVIAVSAYVRRRLKSIAI